MAGWVGSRGPAGATLEPPRPQDKSAVAQPALTLAYFLLAFGTMQAIAYAHRHVADWREGIRFIAAIALLSALAYAALITLGDKSDFAIRFATLLSYSALLITLADLARLNPGRRFAPVSSIILIALGAILLKALDIVR